MYGSRIFSRFGRISLVLVFCFPIKAADFLIEEGLSLEALLNLKVNVASQFTETQLDSSSTVEILVRELWQHYGAETIEDVLTHQPSVMAFPTVWGGTALTVRGYASGLSVRGIATIFDGVPMNSIRRGSGLYEIRTHVLSSLNRIEMIRGPGSVLYGSDAFHGVVSLQTYAAEEDQVRGDLMMTSEHHRQLGGGITHNLNGKTRLNLVLGAVSQGDQQLGFSYTSPITGVVETSSRANQFDAYLGGIKFDVNHSEAFQTHLALYVKGHDSIESVSAGQNLTGNSAFRDRDLSDGENQTEIGKFSFNWLLPRSFNLEGKLYFWEADYEFFTDLINIPGVGEGHLDMNIERNYGTDLVLKQVNNDYNLQWAVGYSFLTAELVHEEGLITDIDRRVVGDRTLGIEGYSRDVHSLIFEGKWHGAQDRIHLIFGNRYDEYSDFGSNHAPRVGLIFKPNPNTSIKARYSEAFRAPAMFDIFGFGRFKGNSELVPETINTIELSYVRQSDFWTFNLTGFFSHWENGIVLVPIDDDPNFSNQYQNIGENEAIGWEVSFRGDWGNWFLDLNASQTESKAIFSSGDVGYDAFPKNILNLNGKYSFKDRGLDLFLTNRILLDMDEGPTTILVPDPPQLDEFFTTDLSLTWSFLSRFQLQGVVRDIFDRADHYPSIWNAENGNSTLGRYYSLRISYRH